MTQRIGYCKLGRSWNLDPGNWSAVGGDVDVWRTLDLLARRHPDCEFVLIGRNSGEDPQEVGLPPNVTQFWTKERRDELRTRVKEANQREHNIDRLDDIVTGLDEMTMDTWRSLDQVIVWAGQHGTSNSRILVTKDNDTYTNPQDSFVLYGSYIVRGITVWREPDPVNREEIWLCPDPRNYVKCRDLRWPLRHPVISQYEQTRDQKFDRYVHGEPEHEAFPLKRIENEHIWVARTTYTYDRLEMTAVPAPDEIPWSLQNEITASHPFGMVINENRKNVSNDRLSIMQEWVMPYFPDAPVFGKWTADSLEKLGRDDISVIANEKIFETMGDWRCTFTTPASGSMWATAKPWEAFLAGTICFFHPKYDAQGHIIPTSEQLNTWERVSEMDELIFQLGQWLRVDTPEELATRVRHLAENDDAYRWLRDAQRRYAEHAYSQMTPIRTIEDRLGLETT